MVLYPHGYMPPYYDHLQFISLWENGILIHYKWKCQLVQYFWSTWQYLQIFKYSYSLPFPSSRNLFQKIVSKYRHKCARALRAALFLTQKNQKNLHIHQQVNRVTAYISTIDSKKKKVRQVCNYWYVISTIQNSMYCISPFLLRKKQYL